MSLIKVYLDWMLLVAIIKLLVKFFLDIWLLFLAECIEFI